MNTVFKGDVIATLTIIVGVGGSGKTNLAQKLSRERSEPYFADATLVNNENLKQRAGYGKLTEVVAILLGQNKSCIIDESFLTNKAFRDDFIKFCSYYLPNVKQEWIFFQNERLKCINNLYYDAFEAPQEKRRNEDSRFKAVYGQIQEYEVPNPQNFPYKMLAPKPVHSCKNPKFHTEKEAINWLKRKVDSGGPESSATRCWI